MNKRGYTVFEWGVFLILTLAIIALVLYYVFPPVHNALNSLFGAITNLFRII